MKYVFILLGIAYALEHFGPFILSKIFPSELQAPAPDVPVRPKRTAARNDSLVDEENLSGLKTPQQLEKLSGNGGSSAANAVVASGPSMLPDSFDYDDFRRENESAQAAISEPVHSMGVPDMFDDSTTATA